MNEQNNIIYQEFQCMCFVFANKNRDSRDQDEVKTEDFKKWYFHLFILFMPLYHWHTCSHKNTITNKNKKIHEQSSQHSKSDAKTKSLTAVVRGESSRSCLWRVPTRASKYSLTLANLHFLWSDSRTVLRLSRSKLRWVILFNTCDQKWLSKHNKAVQHLHIYKLKCIKSPTEHGKKRFIADG